MARPQSKEYSKIRLGILRKAAAQFAKKGYATTTIEDLANATGSSRGALYHYFDSKEAILYEIIVARVDVMTARIQAVIEKTDDPQERCRSVIRAIIELNTASPNESVVLMTDQQYLSRTERTDITRRQNVIVGLVTAVLKEADVSQRLNDANARAYVMTLFGMTNFIYTWYNRRGPLPPEDLADLVADLFLSGFQAPAGTAPTSS